MASTTGCLEANANTCFAFVPQQFISSFCKVGGLRPHAEKCIHFDLDYHNSRATETGPSLNRVRICAKFPSPIYELPICKPKETPACRRRKSSANGKELRRADGRKMQRML